MKITHCFLGTHMGLQHVGLSKIMRTNNVDPTKLPQSTAVLFINTRRDKMKSYAYNGAITYVRFDDKRRRLDLNAVNRLAEAFSPSGHLNYNAALRSSLVERLKSRQPIKELEQL